MADIAVRVSNVTKDFVLPHEKINSLKGYFTNLFRRSGTKEVQHALRGISFEVKEGEFFGVVGRNGGGKSTLLKILAGIYQPTSGTVVTRGKLVPFIELGVGFNPELTGRENVYLNGALLGFSTKEIDAMYKDIVEFAELEPFMDQKLKNYSSGMQVRLAFSVAIKARADILLIDEVLAVGDADFQRKCFDYFKSLKKSKQTVIFVTHDMGAVREYCDRAILIEDGKIAHEGKPSKVADEYLKLFNQNTEDKDKEDQTDRRWGNGQIKIKSLKVRSSGDKIRLTAKLKAGMQGVEEYVFGYRFLDGEGRVVMGGNTLNALNGRKLSLGPGVSTELTFEIPDILGTGTWSVSATVRLDKVTICDNWEDAAVYRSVKEESYYPVIAPATMEVKE